MFIKYNAAQYRALDADAFEARRSEVMAELDNPESAVSTADLTAEVDIITAEVERRNAAVTLRNQNLAAVANGAGALITGTPAAAAPQKRSDVLITREEDPYDTEEYHRAFAEHIMFGTPIPAELKPQVRANAFTQTTDATNYIPTTLASTILEKAQGYGDLWPMLSKTNVQGGVEYNIWDFEPKASWITEAKTSDDQKVTEGTKISFSYHQLEVKLAQSFLTSVTTLAQFEAKFPEVAMKAIVKALEQGYINGTGSGQMLGILKDTRINEEQKIALNAADISSWSAWHKKVKAKMKKSYRDGIFIMAQGTFDAYIDGMVDANGQPVGRTNYGINGEETYRFMGKQVMTVEDDIFPDFDTASDTNAFAVFTKPSDYLVNMQTGMRVSKWADEDNNLIKNKVLVTCDGKILRPWGTLILTADKSA